MKILTLRLVQLHFQLILKFSYYDGYCSNGNNDTISISLSIHFPSFGCCLPTCNFLCNISLVDGVFLWRCNAALTFLLTTKTQHVSVMPCQLILFGWLHIFLTENGFYSGGQPWYWLCVIWYQMCVLCVIWYQWTHCWLSVIFCVILHNCDRNNDTMLSSTNINY